VDLDLAQVRAFVAAADHGHIGRAAASLFLTQQALSKRIARLEDAVGTLLVRGPGGVSLTDRGRRFLPVARQLIDVADSALAAAREEPPPALSVDVWGHLHPPLALVRAFADSHPDAVIELSMRRSLPQSLAALQRHELDLALGNVANLDQPLPKYLTAQLVTSSPLAALVNVHSDLAPTATIRPSDLQRRGLWWPVQASSAELAAFAIEYAEAVGAPLATQGANLGLDVLLTRVAADPAVVTLVAADWPIPADAGVRVVPVRPVPHCPWYALWRTTNTHPLLRPLIHHLRVTGHVPDPARDDCWLPAGTRRRVGR
jgi:DNA-binding transcriptional LysR family regulator